MKDLDPKARALLTAIAAAAEPAIGAIPLAAAREQVEKGYCRMRIPVHKVGFVENRLVPGPSGDIPVRIYIPNGKGPFPVMIFFHGGGWVFFRLDAYDPFCTHLCATSNCIVVSVDYRRSPEHRFPAAFDDCLAAVKWAHGHCHLWNGDPARLFLAGDSAGGNLAAVVALRIRDQGGPAIRGQVLIYPVTGHWKTERLSYTEFAEGYGLTREAMQWFWDQYLGREEDALDPMAVPLLAPDLSGLPPALVIVSGYDPLRDEGIRYAERLKEAGVEIKLSVYEEMIHGFMSYIGILRQATLAFAEIAGWMNETA